MVEPIALDDGLALLDDDDDGEQTSTVATMRCKGKMTRNDPGVVQEMFTKYYRDLHFCGSSGSSSRTSGSKQYASVSCR